MCATEWGGVCRGAKRIVSHCIQERSEGNDETPDVLCPIIVCVDWELLCFLFIPTEIYLQIQAVSPNGLRVVLMYQCGSGLVLLGRMYPPVSVMGRKGDEVDPTLGR